MRSLRLLFQVLIAASLWGASEAAANPGPSPNEPPITTPGVEGDYLRSMHTGIHFRWATKFIDWVAKKRPAESPINNPSLETELLFTVRWDGSPAQVTVSESSGVSEFDAAAADAIRSEDRFPVPPIDIYGDDGVVHVRWIFARDQRLCSGGEIRRFEAPLKDALPRLFVQGRIKEALLRVARYARGGDSDAMSEFARAYLARRFTDPAVESRAAAALVRLGDPRAVDRLKPFLSRAETMPLAAQALAGAKVDLCPLVQAGLKAGNPDAVLLAARTLQAGGAELAPESPCVAAIAALVKNAFTPVTVRAEMLDTLAMLNPNGVRRLALDALGDSDARMRAAGARAFARPRGGRPTLYRLQPLIEDPSTEVRSAVAAGLVRACGDLANDYLQPVFKGRDVQPLIAMAPELGKASSPASADLLAKLEKRPDAELRMPLLAALAARRDPAGRALYQPLADNVKKDPYATPEARRIVYANADAVELLPLTKDPVLGILAYKALLRAQRQAEAMDWLVGSFDRLPPETLVDALGVWLASAPPKPSKG